MVILAAAGAGAAGYGLYKGGEAGIQKGKECHREFQREKKRAFQRSTLREKNKARSSRIAEIMQMKEGGNATSMFGTSSSTASTASPSFSERQLAEKEASADVNDRYRAVTEKLRSGRREEQKKGSLNKKKLSSLNPFKKK